MDINKDTISKFQFIGHVIRNLELKNNVAYIEPSIKKSFDADFKIGENIEIDEEKNKIKGSLVLFVTVSDSKKEKLNIRLELEGIFMAEGINEVEFKRMLELNGTATLYSIARSIISNIVSQTLLEGSIVLPMVNVYALHEKKQEIKKQNELEDKETN